MASDPEPTLEDWGKTFRPTDTASIPTPEEADPEPPPQRTSADVDPWPYALVAGRAGHVPKPDRDTPEGPAHGGRRLGGGGGEDDAHADRPPGDPPGGGARLTAAEEAAVEVRTLPAHPEQGGQRIGGRGQGDDAVDRPPSGPSVGGQRIGGRGQGDDAVDRPPSGPSVGGQRIGGRGQGDDAVDRPPSGPSVGGPRLRPAPAVANEEAGPRPLGDPTVGGIRLTAGSGTVVEAPDDPTPGALPAVAGPRMRGDTGGSDDDAGEGGIPLLLSTSGRLRRDAPPEDAAPDGADPTHVVGSRMRRGVDEGVPALLAENGLDALLRFPPPARSNAAPWPEDDEEEAPPPGPPPLSVVELDAMLAPDQERSPAGELRERISERPFERLDFRWQAYLRLRVTRALYRCPVHPDLDPVAARWPAFIAGKQPFGNGLVARIIEEHLADGAPLPEISRTQSQVGAFVRPVRLAEALHQADAALQPVFAALLEEVAAAPRAIDRTGVRALCPQGRRLLDGRVRGVSSDVGVLLLTDSDPQVARLEDGAKRRKRLAQSTARRLLGRSRSGRWASVRRRVAVALPLFPQEAARGLHLAWTVERGLAAGAVPPEALAAFTAWVDTCAQQAPSALQRAASYAKAHRERLQPVDDQGALLPEEPLGPRDPPVVWRMTGEVPRDAMLRLGSLVETCRVLGLRPWQWLAETLDALAHDQVPDPAAWTPATWAARVGPAARS